MEQVNQLTRQQAISRDDGRKNSTIPLSSSSRCVATLIYCTGKVSLLGGR
jgi:hypothetical protein